MKHLTSLILMALLPLLATGQTANITESLRMLDNSQADVMYDNEFGSFKNPDLDDPFPFVVIKVQLEGDVAQAKRMLSLDLGTMYKVEARNTNKDNMILFLVRSNARSIYLLCGDGCERQELYYGTLIMNKVYTCKVNFSANKQSAASNDEISDIKKQNEEMQKKMDEMQKLLFSMSQNQQQTTNPSQTTTTPSTTTKTTTTTPSATQPTQYPGVVIKNGVLEKVPESFQGHFVISSDVKIIGDEAFQGCSDLSSVTIPTSVTSIGDVAFGECIGLTSVTIPTSVTSIGGGAFYYCSNLTSVTIPNSVTSIGDGTFMGCSGLSSVTIPAGVTTIGISAFNECAGLTSVTIHNSVTSIGEAAFFFCKGLTSVTIPNSVKSIGDGAFQNCSNLKTVTIQGSFTELGGENVFLYCPNLQAIYVPAGTMEYYKNMLPAELQSKVIEQ